MKKKVRFRQFLSGVMAVMTILSTTLSPLSAYAAEPEKKKTAEKRKRPARQPSVKLPASPLDVISEKVGQIIKTARESRH